MEHLEGDGFDSALVPKDEDDDVLMDSDDDDDEDEVDR